MSKERVQRRLAAILAADVVGYSHLMGKDEAGTLERLRTHRKEVLEPQVLANHGRIVKLMGDGVLVEFPSVVEAVECAVAVQKGTAERNRDEPEDQRIAFRIGVNLGDVIVEDQDIYGNGVNVAARLETLAEPGGICVSGRVLDQVEKNVSVGFAYLGPQSVKNIDKPVNVYRVMLAPEDAGKVVGGPAAKPLPTPRARWRVVAGLFVVIAVGAGVAVGVWSWMRKPAIEPASVEKMAFPLPAKPSIAVLPFDNLSGDPEQEHLADGMTESLIATLSQIPDLFVIARNSTFTYKGTPVKVQQVAEELGVRYVLEGSIQHSGDRLRTTVQLIDATTGRHLWADSYDRPLADLFDLQDEIALKTTVALQVKLTEGESVQVRSSTTKDLRAWLDYVRAYSHFETFTREGNTEARELWTGAVNRDPAFVGAWVEIGFTHLTDVRFGYSSDPQKSLEAASKIAKKVSAIAPDLPYLHLLQGEINFARGDFDGSVAEEQRASKLSPSDARIMASLGLTYLYAGRFDDAIQVIRQAMRLNPRFPTWYLVFLGRAYVYRREYGQGIEVARQGLTRAESPLVAAGHHATMAFAYADSGDLEKARKQIEIVLDLAPNVSLQLYSKMYRFKNPQDWQRFAGALRAAGLPE